VKQVTTCVGIDAQERSVRRDADRDASDTGDLDGLERAAGGSPPGKKLERDGPGPVHVFLFGQVRPKDSFRKVAASGGESLEILPWAWDTNVELDPHERALVFMRDRHVVIRHMHNGQEITLDRSLDFPRWSRDGQTVFGTETVGHESFNTWNVVRCQVANRSCSTLTSGHSVVPSPDGQRIYFMRPARAGMRGLWSADVNGGDERALGEIGPFRLPDVMFDVSRDGVVVWPAFHAGNPEIWTAALREASTTR